MNVLKTVSIHSLAVVTALNFLPVNAFAQSQSLDDCSCLVPASVSGQPVGSIVAIDGRVQVSGATGFSDSKVGTMLNGGSRIIVGPRSSASLSLGDKCPLQVSANQDVVLDPVDAKICVRVLDQTTTADVELAPLEATSAFADPFILGDVTRSGVVVSPPVPDAAVRGGRNVPLPKSPTTQATTLDTARAVHAAPNDPVPANSGTPPNAAPNTAQTEDNNDNSVALVVLGLAGVGGIVALALSGGESSVSD
tara:strand:- start:68562 stop:69314 length:753 start_codon:yes stop_codon:yes gene_type:complete